MHIDRILQLGEQFDGSPPGDIDTLMMVISNRIDIYTGIDNGAAVSGKNFAQLAEDILVWHKSRISNNFDPGIDNGGCEWKAKTKAKCDVCGKTVNAAGLADHKRTLHSTP